MFSVKGGDTVQMENTARELQHSGIEVTIELCSNNNIDYRPYRLIHFFNLIRPADMLYHIRKSGLPFVVSPIYVEYEDAARNDRKGWRRGLLTSLGKHRGEYVKTIARAIKNKEKIMSPQYLVKGHRRSIEYILTHCSYLLPNSHSEYRRLRRDFPQAGAYRVVPNAIDTRIFNTDGAAPASRAPGSVLCIARFEPRKNQLRVIEALKAMPYTVTFAGDAAPNHQAYYQACRDAAGPGMQFLGFAGPEEVAALYRRHQVHILASWFETTGLSTLEALACGCEVVISNKGDTEEYFGKQAFYCDPGDVQSIRDAVDRAMQAPLDPARAAKVREQYSWQVTARETASVYQKVLQA